jgi:uncharacterized protein YyaL (SSP411 family)
MRKLHRRAGAWALAAFILHAGSASAATAFRSWDPSIFAEAKAQRRLVILDLKAVWCHWCHVMEEKTYGDAKIAALIADKFIAVRADQDANPDLSNRYGDWGWPATIVFAADGTELAKLQGYIPPERLGPLLEAFVADPTPGPSARALEAIKPAAHAVLTEAQRTRLTERSADAYDDSNGGWGGVHKFVDADAMDLLLAQAAAGDDVAARRARQTLDAGLNLIDSVEGGIYQYSDKADWKSPHYEKIMFYQASGLRQYAQAYALWREPRYRRAADDLYRYLVTVLRTPSGAFATSQDADVDAAIHGKDYYGLDAEGRRALGRTPRVDTAAYARENGWAIQGLVAYYAATGDTAARGIAVQAGEAMLATRARDDGGFRHGETDRGGPYLGDTLAMGQAALDLYAATGDRRWMETASHAGAFIGANFKDESGGVRTTKSPEAAVGAFAQSAKPMDEQIATARFANRLHQYTGEAAGRELAEHVMRYLAAPALIDRGVPMPGVLAADRELAVAPTHITVVGRKDDATARTLHAAALAYPGVYKRVDWWDRQEGPMRNPDVTYPELETAAAFACTNNICSLPAFTPDELAERVARISAVTSQ